MYSINKLHNIVNPIISIILVVIVCSLIGLEKENIIVIVLISCIVLFLFKIILDINKFYNDSLNSIDNISKLDYNNYIKQQIQKNHKDSINTTNTANTNNNLPYHLQNTPDNIIDANMYNLTDCTTDKSCIQKPDKKNLFVGFDKHKTVYNIINNTQNNQNNQNNLNNQNNKFTDEEIVENFENSMTPVELNDIAKPFNSSIINPYKYNSMIEYTELNTSPSMSENSEIELSHVENPDIDKTDELSFHSRKGYCYGDVCHSVNEMPKETKKKLSNMSTKIINKLIKETHPFSSNYPTIRITNPESRF